MTELPTGTVTFLFTDIEGSTPLLERFGALLTEALIRHHALLEDAIRSHGGVVFETVGDAVYAAFADPSDALTAAVAAQRVMRDADWGELGDVRIRIAVHRGPVERLGAHYFGPALYRASRILAIAHGGQTLASAEAATAAARTLPEGITLRPLGQHRLRDLTEPEPIHQVDSDGLPTSFPPPRSVEGRLLRLPPARTTFVGRDTELDHVVSLLGSSRLVTLTGPGGIGKTRLATEVARGALGRDPERFADGAAFVDLAPLRHAHDVAGAIVRALSLRALADEPAEALLVRWLAGRRVLLVLDNWEHLLDGAALVARVLDAAPGLVVLATSRERLRLRGERLVEVGGLRDPADALRLLLDRAGVRAEDLTPEEAAAFGALCVRLDGMPLAIELAGGRLTVGNRIELLRSTRSLADLLRSGPRDLPERQRGLGSTIAWSVRLLQPDEAVLFARLGAFVAPFTAEAAAAVAGPLPGGSNVADVLESLVERSLLRRPGSGFERYGYLEPIREAAATTLADSGEERAISDRHLAWTIGEAEAGEAAFHSPTAAAWLDRLDASFADIAQAREHAVRIGDREAVARIAAAMWRLGYQRSRYVETVAAWAREAARDPTELEPWLRARVFLADGAVREFRSDGLDGLPSIEEARRLLEPLGPSALLAEVLIAEEFLLFSFTDTSLEDRIAILDRAVRMAADVGDANVLAMALGNRVSAHLDAGIVIDGDAADLERALLLNRTVGSPLAAVSLVTTATEYELLRGDLPRAIERARAMLEVREVGEDRSDWFDIEHLGLVSEVLFAAGEHRGAARILALARGIAARSGVGGREVLTTLDRAETRLDAATLAAAERGEEDSQALSSDEAIDLARHLLAVVAQLPGAVSREA